MTTCLVVYYSRTGLTARIAQDIARTNGADIDAIQDVRSRSGLRGFVHSLYDSLAGRLPAILPARKNPAEYEMVILGAPVWAGHVAAPMRSYLAQHRGQFRRLAVFCTMARSGGHEALQEMTTLADVPALARFAFTDREIEQGEYQARLAGLPT